MTALTVVSAPRRDEPTPAEVRARNLLARSVLGHADDLTDRERQVAAILEGEIGL